MGKLGSSVETAFQAKTGTGFTIKTLVRGNGNAEHIWVEVDKISAGIIEGRLANDPVDLGDLKIGSSVAVKIGDLEDWVFFRGDSPVGMFTVPVIQQIERERQKRP